MSDHGEPNHEAEEQPRGAFVLMLLYLLVTAALWAFVYYTLIDRS
ncbi:MAG TPA: hypothetical protein VIL01_13645 [Thermomicrobiales bacterium]